MGRIPPHISALVRSLQINDETVTMSMADLRRLLGFVLASTVVDEGWYLSQYPDVGDETSPDRPEKYADYHFRMHGYLEGRLPADPQLDEAWYLQQYPDVAHAIDMGEI